MLTNAILEVIGLVLAALLAENMVLVRCFGLSFPGHGGMTESAAWHMGAGLTLVMVSSALVSWLVNTFLLRTMELEHFRTLAYALAVLAVVWLLKQLLRLFFPVLFRHLDRSLSMAVSNCAVLGVALLITERSYSLAQALLYALFSGIGTTLVLVAFAGIHEQVGGDQCPKLFRDIPIALITAGLMAMALMGFYGLHVAA